MRQQPLVRTGQRLFFLRLVPYEHRAVTCTEHDALVHPNPTRERGTPRVQGCAVSLAHASGWDLRPIVGWVLDRMLVRALAHRVAMRQIQAVFLQPPCDLH